MARLDKVAANYAKAIFGYLNDPDSTKTIVEELSGFAKMMAEHPTLTQALTNPIFSLEKRNEVIADLGSKLRLSTATRRILHVLSEMGRITYAGAVAEKLKWLQLEKSGVLPIHVETAAPLEAAEKQKLEQRFQKVLGKKVEASYAVNPHLVGGLRATASGKTYDGTLQGWLDTLEQRLVEGAI